MNENEFAFAKLAVFVRARLDEREALYRKFVQPPADPPNGPHESWAMRDIAAKRAIVDAFADADHSYNEGGGFDLAVLESLEMTVQTLAAIDETHPDYQQEWKLP